jgi:putative NADH-flavin reductase
MRIAVFGASGKTGRQVVEQALAAGHQVTAFVRDPAKLGMEHPALRVVRGDISDAARVDEAVRGQDAVVSALGQTKTSGKDVLTVAARVLIPAMERAGVRRLVSLVGAGVPDPRDPSSFGRTMMRALMKTLVGHVLRDAEEHARLLRASGLDWTLVRPPRLTDGPRTGTYRTGILRLGMGETLSRADLAEFMLHAAAEGTFVRDAPMVSY